MTIIPKPELRAFGQDSLSKPPFVSGIPPVGNWSFPFPLKKGYAMNECPPYTHHFRHFSPEVMVMLKQKPLRKKGNNKSFEKTPDQPTKQISIAKFAPPRCFLVSVAELRVHATKCTRSRTASDFSRGFFSQLNKNSLASFLERIS